MEVKFFRFRSSQLAFDVQKVALFQVDPLGRRALKEELASAPGEAARELEQLKEEGFFPASRSDAAETEVPIDVRPLVRNVTLGLTHRCNLRCSYCFAGGYLESKKEPDDQVYKTGLSCLDLMHENVTREPARHRRSSLVFFGGEPLMRFGILKELVHYGRRLFDECPEKLHFGITTNATLLDEEKAVFFRDHGILPLISLDGAGSAHDVYRKTRSGKGSFSTIVKRLRRARQLGLAFGARVTVTSYNSDLVELMDQLDDVGFFNYKFCPLCGEDRFALTNEAKRKLRRSYRKLADLFVARLRAGDPVRFDLFDSYLRDLLSCRGASWCCDAGVASVSVGPTGDVFSCYKLAGEPRTRMGHIDDAHLWAKRPNCDLAEHIDRIPECDSCWIRKICAGGCFADRLLAEKYRQSQCFKTHCEMNRCLVAESIRIIESFSDDWGPLSTYLQEGEKSC